LEIGYHTGASSKALLANVYRRYRIVDQGNMRAALARTPEAVAQNPPTNVTPLRAAPRS